MKHAANHTTASGLRFLEMVLDCTTSWTPHTKVLGLSCHTMRISHRSRIDRGTIASITRWSSLNPVCISTCRFITTFRYRFLSSYLDSDTKEMDWIKSYDNTPARKEPESYPL